MTNIYSNRVYVHEKFWIALCKFPTEEKNALPEYALLKPGQINFSQLETYQAISKDEAIDKGITLAQKHGLYP